MYSNVSTVDCVDNLPQKYVEGSVLIFRRDDLEASQGSMASYPLRIYYIAVLVVVVQNHPRWIVFDPLLPKESWSLLRLQNREQHWAQTVFLPSHSTLQLFPPIVAPCPRSSTELAWCRCFLQRKNSYSQIQRCDVHRRDVALRRLDCSGMLSLKATVILRVLREHGFLVSTEPRREQKACHNLNLFGWDMIKIGVGGCVGGSTLRLFSIVSRVRKKFWDVRTTVLRKGMSPT